MTTAPERRRFPFQAVIGVTIGLLAFVAARLLTTWGRRQESTWDGPGGPTGRGWRPAIGTLLAAVGVAVWAVVAAVVEPAIHAFRLAHSTNFSNEALTAFVILGKDLRWAAMVLAVGGLVLLARARGRRRAVTIGVAGWVLADFALDRSDLGGWLVAAAAALVVGATFLALLRPGRPLDSSGPLPLLYSAAIAIAALLFVDAAGWMGANVPMWTMGVAVGTAVLLVVAAAVNALAAAATPGPPRIVAAILVAAIGGGAVVLDFRWRMGTSHDRVLEFVVLRWLIPLAATALILACALILGGTGRTLRTWSAVAGLAVLGVLVAPSVIFGAMAIGYYAQYTLLPLTGDRAFFDGYPMVLTGILSGIMLGLLSLLPRALSTPPTEPLPPPTPPDPEPDPVETRPARPGEPEVLEHPPATAGLR